MIFMEGNNTNYTGQQCFFKIMETIFRFFLKKASMVLYVKFIDIFVLGGSIFENNVIVTPVRLSKRKSFKLVWEDLP